LGLDHFEKRTLSEDKRLYWRPRRDLNPAEIAESLEFFSSNVAGSGLLWCYLDAGVQHFDTPAPLGVAALALPAA